MKRWLRVSQLARTNRSDKSRAGYTITEVLIVLAITTIMFVAVVAAFSGKQARAEFNQAVRNFENKLQGVMSEVANGSYQGGRRCNVLGSGNVQVVPAAATGGPGSNLECVFLGKIFSGRAATADIVTVLGRRTASTGAIAANLTEANPTAIVGSPVDLTENYSLQYGLRIRRIYALNADGTNSTTTYGAFGFFGQLGGGVTSTNVLSGSPSLLLYGVDGTVSPMTTNITVANVTASTLVPLNEGIRICLGGADANRDMRAEITIGAHRTQTAVEALLDTGLTGACGNV